MTTKKPGIATEIFNDKVRRKLYEDSTDVTGFLTYIVKLMCTTEENPDMETAQEFTFQAKSPEEAKSRALAAAKGQMNKANCRVVDVNMVPNSGEELNNYGGGSALNTNSNATDGQVKPDDVSGNLPNLDA